MVIRHSMWMVYVDVGTNKTHTQLQWRPVVCNVWWINVENNLFISDIGWMKNFIDIISVAKRPPLAKNLKVENYWPNDMAHWSVYAWTKSNEWMNDNCTQIIHVSVWLCCELSCSLVGCVCRRVIMITDGKLQIKWIEWNGNGNEMNSSARCIIYVSRDRFSRLAYIAPLRNITQFIEMNLMNANDGRDFVHFTLTSHIYSRPVAI